MNLNEILNSPAPSSRQSPANSQNNQREAGWQSLSVNAMRIEEESRSPDMLKNAMKRHHHALKKENTSNETEKEDSKADLSEAEWQLNNINKKNEGIYRIEGFKNDEHKRSSHKLIDERTDKTIHTVEGSLPNYITTKEEKDEYKRGFEKIIGSKESVANDTTVYGYVPNASELPEPTKYNNDVADPRAEVSSDSGWDSMKDSSDSNFNGSTDASSSSDSDGGSDNDNSAQSSNFIESRGTKRKAEAQQDVEQHTNKKNKKDNDDDEPKGSGLSGSSTVPGSENLGGDNAGPSNFRAYIVDYSLIFICNIFSTVSELCDFINYL